MGIGVSRSVRLAVTKAVRRWLRVSALLAAATTLGCWNTQYGVPAYQIVGFAALLIKDAAVCAVTGCPATLPEGMTMETFAEGEILPAVPVAIDADEWGRLYVAEGGRIAGGVEDNRQHGEGWYADDLASRSVEDRLAYIEKWHAKGEPEAADHYTRLADRLIRLEDHNADGVAEKAVEIARFNDVVDGPAAGVLARNGEVFLAAIPNVYKVSDSPDASGDYAVETLASGFGVKTSLMGHDLHGLTFGPDGKLYFSMGDRGYSVTTQEGERLEPTMGPGRGAVFRMEPDGSKLEVFATGVRNPQELAFDDYGNLFTGDNNGDGGDRARLVYLVDGGETGWAMPYQTLIGDYVRGPWVAERLWELQHEGQPAWVLPPVAYVATGPSGFAAYPGLGLPERYDGHFFLADYRYQRGLSGVLSFAASPKGASFEMTDEHSFVGSILSTDVDFGYDGRIYVSAFDQIGGSQYIAVTRHEQASQDPRIAETVQLVQEGMGERSTAELTALLSHADRRVRQRAQFELARRADPAPLRELVLDPEAPAFARLHGLWGLGQMGAKALESLGLDLAWADRAEPELLNQAIKLAGDRLAAGFAPALLRQLDAESVRTQFFAAQSLGRLGHNEAVAPLIEALRRNDNADVYLRHAIVFALHRIGELEQVWSHRGDSSSAVRLGVLLALRHAQDARIADFLEDEDPFLRLEAARAIHDLPIADALPRLATLAQEALPADDDPQSSFALHRRFIGANRSLGTEEAATALAAHAANPRHPLAMRSIALESLAEFLKPNPRDLVMGFHRPLEERPPSVVFAALDRHGVALVEGELGDRALEVAEALGRIPLDDEQLAEQVEDSSLDLSRRVAALRVLAGRDGGTAARESAWKTALASDSPELRAEARDAAPAERSALVLSSIQALDETADLRERQRGFATLGRMPGPDAAEYLRLELDRLRADGGTPALALDVVQAARLRPEAEVHQAVAAYDEELTARHGDDLTKQRSWALAGGDPEAGRLIFQGAGDCQRCHSSGHGAAGPDLAGIGSRKPAAYLLESVIEPQTVIAPGFATQALTLRDGTVVSGLFLGESEQGVTLELTEGGRQIFPVETISTRSPLASGMPPMGLTLRPGDLRDLIAYLQSL